MGELGSLLSRAREARGLTIEDAERDTRISRRYLQALEAEQFEVIPAPVYARGFLRSYSQYLGLDPQETQALFPRDDEPSPYHAGATQQSPSQRGIPAQRGAPAERGDQQRGAQQRPVTTVGAERPTWKRPSQQAQGQPRQAPPARARPQDAAWEPMIGVDIGVPAPARRLQKDPAAQTRSLTVLVVAVGAIIAVVLMALAISQLGGNGEGGSPFGARTQTTTAGPTPTTGAGQTQVGTSDVTPGIMPNVIGLTESAARSAVSAAGVADAAVSVTRQPNAAAKNLVFDQFPAAGVELQEGDQIILAVSDGP